MSSQIKKNLESSFAILEKQFAEFKNQKGDFKTADILIKSALSLLKRVYRELKNAVPTNNQARKPWDSSGGAPKDIKKLINDCITVQDPGERIVKFLNGVLPQQQQHGGAGELWWFLLFLITGVCSLILYGLYWIILETPARAIIYIIGLINKQTDESRFLTYILLILSMKNGLTEDKNTEEITKLWSHLVGHLVSTKSIYLASYYGLILRFLTGGDGNVDRGQLPAFVTAAAEDIEKHDKNDTENAKVYYSNLYIFPCYPPKMYTLSHKAAGFRMMAAEIQLHMAYHIDRCIKLIKIPVFANKPNLVDKMARKSSQVALVKKLLIEKDMSELLNKLQSLAKEEPKEKRFDDDETFNFDQIRSIDVKILNGFEIYEKITKFDLYIQPVRAVGGGANKKPISPYNIFMAKHRRAGKTMKEIGALWQKTKQ